MDGRVVNLSYLVPLCVQKTSRDFVVGIYRSESLPMQPINRNAPKDANKRIVANRKFGETDRLSTIDITPMTNV